MTETIFWIIDSRLNFRSFFRYQSQPAGGDVLLPSFIFIYPLWSLMYRPTSHQYLKTAAQHLNTYPQLHEAPLAIALDPHTLPKPTCTLEYCLDFTPSKLSNSTRSGVKASNDKWLCGFLTNRPPISPWQSCTQHGGSCGEIQTVRTTGHGRRC